MIRITRRRVLAAALAFAASGVAAQGFPSRPLRFVVPFAAGSTTDQAARFLAQHIGERTKQPVIVENKPGASGLIALQYALTLPVDGYTVVIGTSTTHAANTALFKKLPYDPVADFVPISGISIGGVVLVVSPTLKANNVQELIALARQKPGVLTFGAGNSSSQIGGALFKELAKADIVHVAYKALPAAMTDLLGSQIDMSFADGPAALPLVRSGKLRALGVSTRERMPGLENVPTIAEQGVPGYEVVGWLAAFAPKGTPPELADKLNELFVAVLRTPEAARLFGESAWRAMPMTRKEMGDFQKSEIERWGRQVRGAGIEPE